MKLGLSRESLAIGAIVLLAFVLRAWGVGYGLPHTYHADEPIVVNHALAYGTFDFNPHFFRIPPLVSYLLFACYGLFFVVGNLTGVFGSVQDFESLFFSDPSSFYLIARFVFGVFLGTATVYMVFCLARKYLSLTVAYASAFLLAVCFLHVRDSHYVYVDIPLLFVLVVTFYQLCGLYRNPYSLGRHIVVGAFVGLCIATKYNGGAVLVVYLLLSTFHPQRKNLFGSWIVAGLASTVVYTLLNPFSWIDFSFFMQELQSEASVHHGGVGWLHHFIYSLRGAMGTPFLVASVLAIIWALISKCLIRISLAVFALVYYVVICKLGQPYDRYVLPLMPFLVLLVADFLVSGLKKIGKDSKVFIILGVAIVGVPSLARAVLSDHMMATKDIRTEAKDWIENNLPSGSRIALDWEFYMPRLQFSKSQLLKKKRLILSGDAHSEAKLRRLESLLLNVDKHRATYDLYFLVSNPKGTKRFLMAEPVIGYDFNSLKAKNLEYVLLADLHEERNHAEFYERVEREGELVKVFSPYRDESRRWPYDKQAMTGAPFLWEELFARRTTGQPIRLYRLKS